VWDHPDLLPTTEDLDDPQGYARRTAEHRDEHADVDRALAEIFGEEAARESSEAGGTAAQDEAPAAGSPGPDDEHEAGPEEPTAR